MTNFIPIFPLEIVVYPREALNLHIFEPRYIQLINDCIAEQKPFGLPTVQNNSIAEYGTLMEIKEVSKRHENGDMDIKTVGTKVFRMLHLVKEVPDKLYCGAIVNYPRNVTQSGDSTLADNVLAEVKRLFELLDLGAKFPPEDRTVPLSYQIAHFVGLNPTQEYELLSIFNELQRLEYLRRYLNALTPVLQNFEKMKERIKQNGHFRNLSWDDLNL